MRLQKAYKYSLNHAGEKRQVIDLQDFKAFKDSREAVVVESKSQGQFDVLADYDALTIAIALKIYRAKGNLGRSQIEKAVKSTTAKVIRRLKWLTQAGFIRYEEKPHRNPGMPASYIYYPTDALSVEVLEHFEQDAQAKEAKPDPHQSAVEEPSQLNVVSVQSALEQLRPNAIKSHVELLFNLAKNEELSMYQAAELSGSRPQTEHGRLQKLHQFGLLSRTKKLNPDGKPRIHFSIKRGISLDEISELAHKYGISSNQSQDSSTSAILMHPDSSDNQQRQSAKQSATEMLVARLPEFDPSWPQEVKQSWFESYQKLIEMSQKSSN